MNKKLKKDFRRQMKKAQKQMRHDLIAKVDAEFKGPFHGFDSLIEGSDTKK